MNMCAVISVVLLILGLSYTSAASTLLDKIKEDPDLSQVSHTYSKNNNNNRSFNSNRVHFMNYFLEHVCYVYHSPQFYISIFSILATNSRLCSRILFLKYVIFNRLTMTFHVVFCDRLQFDRFSNYI